MPFDAANPATWPTEYHQQKPVLVTYRSQEFGLFAQNDWRLGNGVNLNAGLRYDIDLTPAAERLLRASARRSRLPGSRPLHQPRPRHLDLDGDSSQIGDLPDGIPITVGRERIDESLAAINAFRASRRLAPIDRSLLEPDPYRTLDVRLTKSLAICGDRRLEAAG